MRKNPGRKHAKVYKWEKTQSSGGQQVYQRIKVNKKSNKDTYYFYKPHQRVYNAFANEWDLCEDFNFGNKDGHNSNSDSDYDNVNYPTSFVSQPKSLAALALMDVVEREDSSAAPTCSRDPIKTLSLVYGDMSVGR